jgi:sarcosine oxidase
LTKTIFEFAVIGAGLTGSAAAKYISELTSNTALIGPSEPDDKINHEGIFGSHYDEGRITRVSDSNYGWSYLAKKSIENYSSIKSKSKIEFYDEVGTLSIGTVDYINELTEISTKIDCEYVTDENFDLYFNYQYLNFPENSKFILETKQAGHISPRKLVEAQKSIFKDNNGTYINDFAISIKKSNGIFVINTNTNIEIHTDKILIATGAFTNFTNILPKNLPTKIRGRTIVLGEVKAEYINELKKYPSFIHKPNQNTNNREYTYCLPAITYPNGKTYVKIGGSKHFTHINTYDEAIDWFKGKTNSMEIDAITNELNTIYDEKLFNTYHTDTCVTTWTKTLYPIIDEIENNLYVSVGGNGSAAKSSDYIGYISANYFTKNQWDDNLDRNLFTLESNQI